ncbi:MAG: hypothetical protein M0Z63_04115 [Actinomycetota bacterium]|jgi:hypothetical protein|nr:hypothetical protein [Actinomycetota bacterium]
MTPTPPTAPPGTVPPSATPLLAPVEARASRWTTWPLERALFALAGSFTLLSVLLGVVVSKWFLLLAGVVGVNQWAFVALGRCPASIVLQRACGLRSLRAVTTGDKAAVPAAAR